MTREDLLSFLRPLPLAVEASHAAGDGPQAAVVGVVVDEALQIFFDTLGTSRNASNLRQYPRIALVMGGSLDDPRTAQIEGIADEPVGSELEGGR